MKNRKIIFLISSLLFTLLFCLVFYYIYNKILDNKNSTQILYGEWKTEEDRREVIKSLDRTINKIQDKKIILESHFVGSSDVVPYLDFFEKSAVLVNAKSEVSSVSVPSDNSTINVSLDIDGSFESIYKYINLIENAPYELHITSFTLNKINNTTGISPNLWNLNLQIKLLSFTQ